MTRSTQRSIIQTSWNDRQKGEDALPVKKKKKRERNLPLSLLWNQDRGHHPWTKQRLVSTVELHPWRQRVCRRGSSTLAEREWMCAEDECARPVSALSCYWSPGWPAITVWVSMGHTLWDSKLNWHSPMWDRQWVQGKAPMKISWWIKKC